MIFNKAVFDIEDILDAIDVDIDTLMRWFKEDNINLNNTSHSDILEYLDTKIYNVEFLNKNNIKTYKVVLLSSDADDKMLLMSKMIDKQDSLLYQVLFYNKPISCNIKYVYDIRFKESTYCVNTDINEINVYEYKHLFHNVNNENVCKFSNISREVVEEELNNKLNILEKIKYSEYLYNNVVQSESYLEMRFKPSEYMISIMNNLKTDRIEFIDINLNSSVIDFNIITKQDLYIVLLNESDIMSYNLVDKLSKISLYTLHSKVLFIYNEIYNENFISYENMIRNVRFKMKFIQSIFNKFKYSIIDDYEILNPYQNYIFNPMRPRFLQDSDKITAKFNNDLKDLLVDKLSYSIANEYDNIYDIIAENDNSVYDFIRIVLKTLPEYETHYKLKDINDLRFDDFDSIENTLLNKMLLDIYKKEIGNLYKHFENFSSINYLKDYEIDIFKSIFKIIIFSIGYDYTISVTDDINNNLFSKKLSVFESLNFKDMLFMLINVEKKNYNCVYNKLIRSKNLKCSTQNIFVKNIKNSVYASKRFEINNILLKDMKHNNMYDLIHYYHVYSLRKMAEYNILSKIGYTDEESFDIMRNVIT